jgi:hypothetical protein
MSLTIDELCQSSCYRRRTSDAAPARSHHTGLGAFCTTLFALGLARCPALAPGSGSDPWDTYGHGYLARHGARQRAPFHELPPGLEPGHLVSPPRQWDSAGGSGRCSFCRRSAGRRRSIVCDGMRRVSETMIHSPKRTIQNSSR